MANMELYGIQQTTIGDVFFWSWSMKDNWLVSDIRYYDTSESMAYIIFANQWILFIPILQVLRMNYMETRRNEKTPWWTKIGIAWEP